LQCSEKRVAFETKKNKKEVFFVSKYAFLYFCKSSVKTDGTAMKKLLRRHKYILLALGVYWPLVFTLTHIPVQDIAGQSGMSDKTMHATAYFALTFLLWCAVNPYRRVRWNERTTWVVAAAVAVYGALDEYLQGFVGRSAEMQDFLANMCGMVLAMGVLGVFEFWPALLTASALAIFVVSNLSNLTGLYAQYHLNTAFYFGGYAGLTLIWIQHLEQYLHLRRNRAVWFGVAAALPLVLLGGTLAAGPYFGKTVWGLDAATAVCGIAAAILTSRLAFAVTQKKARRRESVPKNP
jgi:hypothetical protein